MREATKTRRLLGEKYTSTYLSGKVLDIGCGPDLIVPDAQPFDMEHGDANRIASYLPSESFDCVHSSHCLEHMRDVPSAIEQWWSLVKPGGTMIIAVPEENLYEQGVWPPMFNTDHKATFRWDSATSWSPVSYDLKKLVQSLPAAEIVEAAVQDTGYDYKLQSSGGGSLRKVIRFFSTTRSRICRRLGLTHRPLDLFFARIEFRLGCPVDQTGWDALAQIHVIVRKRVSHGGRAGAAAS